MCVLTTAGDVEGQNASDAGADVPLTGDSAAGEVHSTQGAFPVDETETPGAVWRPAQRSGNKEVGSIIFPAAVARVGCKAKQNSDVEYQVLAKWQLANVKMWSLRAAVTASAKQTDAQATAALCLMHINIKYIQSRLRLCK